MSEHFSPEQKFLSPHEELAFLREQVAKKEKEIGGVTSETQKENIIHEAIHAHAELPKEVVHESYRVKPEEVEGIVLNLAPEEHDGRVSELLSVLQEKGIKNVLMIVESLNDPHLEDDIHRFLVQYIKGGYSVPGLKEKSVLWKELHIIY